MYGRDRQLKAGERLISFHRYNLLAKLELSYSSRNKTSENGIALHAISLGLNYNRYKNYALK